MTYTATPPTFEDRLDAAVARSHGITPDEARTRRLAAAEATLLAADARRLQERREQQQRDAAYLLRMRALRGVTTGKVGEGVEPDLWVDPTESAFLADAAAADDVFGRH